MQASRALRPLDVPIGTPLLQALGELISNAKISRIILWGAFLLVALFTTGLHLTPEGERDFAGMFQAALFFSGVPVVIAGEFHIQRFERRDRVSVIRLALILVALLPTYYAISSVAAHSSTLNGWLLLFGWLFAFVGVFSVLPKSRLERRILVAVTGVFAIACCFIAFVSLGLWPNFYYGYLKPQAHLEWTPYFMGLVGLLFWGSLLAVNIRVKNVT